MTACPSCGGTGWLQKDSGVTACACRRQPACVRRTLCDQDLAEVSIAATEASNDLGAMPDYPWDRDKPARDMVASAIARMCSSPAEVRYVVRRAIELFPSWKKCGVPGLRQVLISKYPARDGIETGPQCISENYPEGIPGEKDGMTGSQPQIVSPPLPALPPGAAVTADPAIDQAVLDMAKLKRLHRDRPRQSAESVQQKLEQMGL